MKYYLTTDLKDGYYYIAPFGKLEPTFLIRFDKKYEAENFLKNLLIYPKQGPYDSKESYELLEILKGFKNKESVFIFKLKV